jgi:hypothetical protein
MKQSLTGKVFKGIGDWFAFLVCLSILALACFLSNRTHPPTICVDGIKYYKHSTYINVVEDDHEIITCSPSTHSLVPVK